MEKNYILNTKRGKLHYKGYCKYVFWSSDNLADHYKCFATENEAKAQNGLSISWCSICARKREQELTKK